MALFEGTDGAELSTTLHCRLDNDVLEIDMTAKFALRTATIVFLVLGGVAKAEETRLPTIPEATYTRDQKAAAAATVSGPRKTIDGPFAIWLRSPELENRLQQVGQYVRFDTSLPHKLNEFAILVTAVQWKAPFEWSYHYPLAIKEGMEPDVLKVVSEGKRPDDMSDDEALVYDFTVQLIQQKQVSDAVYDASVKKFGERGFVDLIAVDGYYSTVSMTLNVGHYPASETGGPRLTEAAVPK